MLAVKSLRKAEVPSSLLEYPSPGNIQSTRLALHVNDDASSCWVYIASGFNIYKLLILIKDDTSVNLGKQSLLIPQQTSVVKARLARQCPHRSEIQSIVLAESDSPGLSILGSVDSYGHLIVSKLNINNGSTVNKVTYSVSPTDSGIGEGSWAGLCFSPTQWSMSAVARSFCRSIDIYDQDIHLQTLRTLWHPTSLKFIKNLYGGNEDSIIAVTESSQLTIWDLRVKEKGGCVHRISGSIGDMLYAVCNSETGNVAVGGADRTVTVYDPRRWSSLSRWVHCSKYEVTGLSFSSTDPDYIYVQGVDYEVFCGDWKHKKTAFSFRGDSNWLGFNKSVNGDVLGGWCDSGNIFLADIIKRDEVQLSQVEDDISTFEKNRVSKIGLDKCSSEAASLKKE